MLRILGTGLLMAALAGLCLQHARREEARVGRCEGLLLLVRHLRTQISCFREPLDRALATFENAALSEMGFLAVMRERGLGAAIASFRTDTALTAQEWGMLAAFAAGLGGSYTHDAVTLCEETERALSSALRDRRAEAPARRRVGHSLLIFGALSLLLLFG